MKILKLLTVVSVVSMMAFAAPSVDVKGARKGVWSSDFAAVKAAAKADNSCIFILFTGSDWCYWCKLMDNMVFSKDLWKAFASRKLYLAYIDFPKDESKISEDVHNQNIMLQESFNVDGYPTMFLLDSDGSKIDEFHAARGITAETFIPKVKKALLFAPAELEATYSQMPAEEVKAIKANGERLKVLNDELSAAKEKYQKAMDDAKREFSAASDRIQKEQSGIADPRNAVLEYLLKTKAPEAFKDFQTLSQQQKALEADARKRLEALNADPAASEDAVRAIIQDFEKKNSELEARKNVLCEQIFK